MISTLVAIASILFVSVIMLLRCNDFRRKAHPLTPHVAIRIVGFVLSGIAPWGVVAFWVLAGQTPSIFMTVFLLGIACVFYTSPNMPPFFVMLTQGSKGE